VCEQGGEMGEWARFDEEGDFGLVVGGWWGWTRGGGRRWWASWCWCGFCEGSWDSFGEGSWVGGWGALEEVPGAVFARLVSGVFWVLR